MAKRSRAQQAYRRSYKKRAVIRGAQRGYLRVGGYYGRFGPKLRGRKADGGENKFFDTAVGQTASSTTGAIFLDSICLIPQGVTESTRVGRKCTLRSISMRGQMILPSQTSKNTTTDRLRYIIYLDKQTNGATATVLGLLESTDVNSFRNLAESGRFKVLADNTIALNTLAGSGDGTTEDYGIVSRNFVFNKRCNIPLEFSATTGAITELRSSNIGILFISESARANLQANIRVRFSDN